MSNTPITWVELSFHQLTLEQLYSVIKLRIDVFIVEQECPYEELDDKDALASTRHLLGLDNSNNVVAYSRILAPGVSYPQPSIGRVVIDKRHRGKGLGYILMNKSIEMNQRLWPHESISISAQSHLKEFYASLGFKQNSDIYLEDGIPHINMLL